MTTGLRRFVKREPGPPAELGSGAAGPAERCELCRAELGERHGHLVDAERRSLACACRACYLLFTHPGAAGGRYRAVPETVYHDPERHGHLAAAVLAELQIPVAMAFFFHNSALGRLVAGYPSPGGATECELDLAAWDRLAAGYPLLAAMAPDIEAIFVSASPGGRPPQTPPAPPDGDEVFLIPVDLCYALVGELRLCWQGFDGGAEARAALAAFLDDLRCRALPLDRAEVPGAR